ncbi:hypothetical protein AMTR_s00015p00194770 [Amborella trichopoda]|uniref:Uncharacterized protein n=1 Tax=Amborella trichopoda TaxID=13333 RepID=W1PM66_AMBTC|nr:hypothetical protein AMTR_s00015p00194770 [Amborella trichopoda]
MILASLQVLHECPLFDLKRELEAVEAYRADLGATYPRERTPSKLKDLLRDLSAWGSGAILNGVTTLKLLDEHTTSLHGVLAKKNSFLQESEEERKRLIIKGIRSAREDIELSRDIARVESEIAPLQAHAVILRAH